MTDVQNPPIGESKTAKKRKAKAAAVAATAIVQPPAPTIESAAPISGAASSTDDGNFESPYIKELEK